MARGGAHAVLFDVDGTLVDSNYLHVHAWQRAFDAEGMVVADCDLRATLHAKRWFDVAGHYGREDVLNGQLAQDAVTPSTS